MSERYDREYPKIRPVEAFPHYEGPQQGICLRDPRGIASNILVLPLPVFFVATLFDGRHSILDIQEAFTRRFQQLITRKQIEEIICRLDEELYMDTETFQRALEVLREEFRAAPFREPAHAGAVYHPEPEPLKAQLRGYLEAIGEDGSRPAGKVEDTSKRLKVLIAPHIDFHRGGIGFAHAYREISRSVPADLYLIFGTAHQSQSSQFILTAKDYNTPLGRMETDVEFVERFSREAPVDVFEEELLHRNEHSAEFQAVWLRYMLDGEWRGKIVPILCGSFHRYVMEGTSPRQDPVLSECLDLLRRLVDEYPGEVALVAGVDLSHVGKRFGHERGISAMELARVERDDREVLEAIQSGEAERFFGCVAGMKDRNNVCGLSPIYMVLDVARPGPGRFLFYDQAIERETESVVTFASFSFYEE
ncbi:MAG: AmmeMemoRadiSam system protein B [bacterium]